MRRLPVIAILLTLVTCWTASAAPSPKGFAPSIPGAQRIAPDAATGASQAVVIGDLPLVHTTQFLPLNSDGTLAAAGDVAAQTRQTLTVLGQTLTSVGSTIQQLVKLNVYVTQDTDVAQVQPVLAKFFLGDAKPAVCFVTTTLPTAGALVAMDAIAVARADMPDVVTLVRPPIGPANGFGAPAAVLPSGSSVYISGQAEKGELGEATRKTLESLLATLKHLNLGREHIVQLKAFLQPMADLAIVKTEFINFFGNHLPPVVWVEWKGSSPIEIELIASAPKPASDKEAITYFTPPGMKPSPVYSKVAQINSGRRIYISGLHASRGQNGEAQVKETFATLQEVLKQARGDLKHLVKATYYVADDSVSAKLNELRPNYYDPQRPPAASKAMVRGVAAPGRTLVMDMIAVAP